MKTPQQYLDPSCPYDSAYREEVRTVRRRLLDMGYVPIALHSIYSMMCAEGARGKQPGTEMVNGEKRSWREGHSREKLMKATYVSGNTGVVTGGPKNLLAIDIDPEKTAPAEEGKAFALKLMEAMLGGPLGIAVRDGLVRTRWPNSVAILARTDRPMKKIKIKGRHGAIELLVDGEQIAVHRDHPLTRTAGVPVRWEWGHDRPPWNVSVMDLPILAVAGVQAEIERLRASGVFGPPVNSNSGVGGVGVHGGASPRSTSTAYPATQRLHELFKKHEGWVSPAVRELIAETKEGDRHDTIVAVCGRLSYQKWTERQVLDLLLPAIGANPQFTGFGIEEVQKAFDDFASKDRARQKAAG